jgi:hypothetical protein
MAINTTSIEGTDGQAERAGPQGPEASGIKAGWPRFGTKRGAQPASPTAERRDAYISVARNSDDNFFGFEPPLF